MNVVNVVNAVNAEIVLCFVYRKVMRELLKLEALRLDTGEICLENEDSDCFACGVTSI